MKLTLNVLNSKVYFLFSISKAVDFFFIVYYLLEQVGNFWTKHGIFKWFIFFQVDVFILLNILVSQNLGNWLATLHRPKGL